MREEEYEREIICPIRGRFTLCREDCAWRLGARCAVVAIAQWANAQRERAAFDDYRAELKAQRGQLG